MTLLANYTPEQQATNRKEWAKLLRSGKYKQGQKKLKDNDTYCCLGVAADAFGPGKWSDDPNGKLGHDYTYTLNDRVFRDAISLPAILHEYFGMNSVGGFISTCGIRVTNDSLVTLNDTGYTFVQIAEILENPNIKWHKAHNLK